MSSLALGLLFIPGGLVASLLGLAAVGAAAGLREISRRRVEQVRQRTSNELNGLLERVEQTIKVGEEFKASEFAAEEYKACVSELKQLSAQVEAETSATTERLSFLRKQAQTLAQKTAAMVAKASREVERVAAVKVTLEVLDRMEFSSEVRTSQDGKWVTVIATGGRGVDGGQKQITIDIDDENHIRADFHEGYAGFALGDCDEDAHRFFTTLQELGAEVRNIQVVPEVPTWRGGGEQQLPAYHNRQKS